MTNDRHVAIRKSFFDFQLNHSATHVDRVGNVRLIALIFLANIDNHRVGAFRF